MQASWASMFLLAGVACGACSSSDDAAGETDAGLQPGDGASDGDGSVGCAMPLSDFLRDQARPVRDDGFGHPTSRRSVRSS